jgi:hypothetical protein
LLTSPLPRRGITAGELFKNIQAAHFNINTGMQERDEQKRKLAEKKNATVTLPPDSRGSTLQ